MKNYNIGSGGFRHKDWTNVDHHSDWYNELQGKSIAIDWDLLSMTPIPIDSNSADLVYSSHTIEHITNEAALNMFKEIYRILKPDGLVRIQSPNIDLFYLRYLSNLRIPWADAKTPKLSIIPLKEASLQQSFVWCFATNASELHIDGSSERLNDSLIDKVFEQFDYEEALNFCISKTSLKKQRKYPGNHINWWNPVKTLKMLKSAGFKKYYVSSFGESNSQELRDTSVFDKGDKEISFYVEARRANVNNRL